MKFRSLRGLEKYNSIENGIGSGKVGVSQSAVNVKKGLSESAIDVSVFLRLLIILFQVFVIILVFAVHHLRCATK
jgi:hypothetical protein